MKQFLKLKENKFNLEDLKKLEKDTELTIDLCSINTEFFDEIYPILLEKNLVEIIYKFKNLSTNLSIEFTTLITTLYMYIDNFNDSTKYKEFLLKMKNLKILYLEYSKINGIELFDMLPDSMNHLLEIEFQNIKIDDSFNRVFSNSKLKKMHFDNCIFDHEFKFKINLNHLIEIKLLLCLNISMKNLYESIKVITHRISFFYANIENKWNDDHLNYFISIMNNIKFSLFYLSIYDNIFVSIFNRNIKSDIQKLYFPIYTKIDLTKFISNIENLEEITFHSFFPKDILQVLKNQKKLEKLIIYCDLPLNLKDFFNYLNHSNVQNLSLSRCESEKSKEFFELFQENTTIKLLKIEFWNDAIYDMIINNNTLTFLEMNFLYRKEDEIKRLFQSLEKNKNLNGLRFNLCDYFPFFDEYFKSNPKITSFYLQTKPSYYSLSSLFESLSFNTNLQKLVISSKYIKIEDIKKSIDYLFQYNYTLIHFKIQDLFCYEIHSYIKRNKDLSKIYKFTKGEDLYFKFL